MIHPTIIIGAGGHAKVLIACLNALQHEIIGVLHPDISMAGQTIAGIEILGPDDKVFDYNPDAVELVNGIGSISSTAKREAVFRKFKQYGYLFATIIHPTAVVMPDVQLGEGVQIMAGAIVQTGCSVGNNTIINTGAIVDHGGQIGEHVHVAPGAVLSGEVHVGSMTHIGTAATIIQGIDIGVQVVVGAGAVVLQDISENQKVVGNPAKVFV